MGYWAYALLSNHAVIYFKFLLQIYTEMNSSKF